MPLIRSRQKRVLNSQQPSVSPQLVPERPPRLVPHATQGNPRTRVTPVPTSDRDIPTTEDRVVHAFLAKLKEKVTVFSGLTLDALFRDSAVTETVESLCVLAVTSPSPNVLVLGLGELLDRVGTVHVPPMQVIHSQIFLLHVVTLVLEARARQVPASPPLPLDPSVTHKILSVLLPFVRTTTADLVPSSFTPSSMSGSQLIASVASSPGDPRGSLSSSVRLTPLPRVPLHGFELIAAPDAHTNARLVSPGAIWDAPAPLWGIPEEAWQGELDPGRVGMTGQEDGQGDVAKARTEIDSPTNVDSFSEPNSLIAPIAPVPPFVTVGTLSQHELSTPPQTMPSLVPTEVSSTSSTNSSPSPGEKPTLMSLYTQVDLIPAPSAMLTLSFLPPAVLRARLAARALHHLSVPMANWTVLFERVLDRLRMLSDEDNVQGNLDGVSVKREEGSGHGNLGSVSESDISDGWNGSGDASDFSANAGQEMTELRMLGFLVFDRERISRTLHEIAGRFVSLGPTAQAVCAIAIRLAIFAWLENTPQEFIMLHQDAEKTGDAWESPPTSSYTMHHPSSSQSSSIHLEGRTQESTQTPRPRGRLRVPGADRLLDALRAVAAERPRAGDPARSLLWPTIGALLVLCPERIAAAMTEEKSTILTQLAPFTHSPGPLADIALRVYADLCRAAFFLPPRQDGALVTVARDVADDLADLLERYPPYGSSEAIDVELYTDAFVAVYRMFPMRAQPLIRAWLDPQRSPAVKLCFVRAAMTLIVEASAFPWQPSLLPLIQASSKRLLHILAALISNTEEPDTTSAAATRPLALGQSTDLATLQRTLAINIQGLMQLDFAFAMYGPSPADHAVLFRAALQLFNMPRDHGMLAMCLRTFSTWVKVAHAVPRGGRFHTEAIEYMNGSILAVLFACARHVVHVWNTTDDIVCINTIYHILRLLSSLGNIIEDTSWTLVEARLPALEMVEIALYLSYTSYRPDIVSQTVKALHLLEAVSQDPYPRTPDHLTRKQAGQCSPVLGTEGTIPHISAGTGGAVLQKRLRNHFSKLSTPCATHLSGWRERLYRWGVLSQLLGIRAPEGRDLLPENVAIGPETYKDREIEWTNHTLSLACCANVCVGDIDLSSSIGSHLPDRVLLCHDSKKLMNTFIADLVDLLTAEAPQIRLTATRALGAELHVQAIPVLFEHLNTIIPDLLRNTSQPPNSTITFVDQIIQVFSLLADRMEKEEKHFLKCDMSFIALPILRFIDRPALTVPDQRSRAQLCLVSQKLMSHHNVFIFRHEKEVVRQALEVAMNWVSYSSEDEGQKQDDFLRLQRNTQILALRFASRLSKCLRLNPRDGATDQDTQNVASRTFHRYLNILIKSLDLARDSDSMSPAESDRASQGSGGSFVNAEAPVLESIISGISNLVSANAHIGFKQCLDLGYDEDPRLRAVIMEVFARVLKRGTRLEDDERFQLGTNQCQLCELVRGSEDLMDAVAIICAPGEIDYIVPVLLNVLDTRRAIVSFVQRLIAREVTAAESTVDLFRQNNFCNRLLSAFANQHGYDYLRSIVSPLLDKLMELPAGSSFELDPSKLRPDEDLETNARLVFQITQSFIDNVTGSGSKIPSIVVDACHSISRTVAQGWPDSQYSVLGGFLFLRFICPAIVSPDIIDLELPRQDPRILTLRRGLVLVAKILQNLANNMLFGKEAYLMLLNPLLKSNFRSVTTFLAEPFKYPSQDSETDQWLGTTCDDTDTVILERFFRTHLDEVGRVLLSRTPGDAHLTEAPNKVTWDRLCSILLRSGPVSNPPITRDTTSSNNSSFTNFMSRTQNRNTEPVHGVFQRCKEQHDIFVLRLDQINVQLTDLEVLMRHILLTLKDHISSPTGYNLVVDCTAFSPESELPMEWIKLFIDLTPADIRRNVHVVYILNANSVAQRFLRKVFYLFTGVIFAREITSVSSVSELFNNMPHVESIAHSKAGVLESEASQFCDDVLQRKNLHSWHLVTLDIRVSHLRITSKRGYQISSRLFSKSVEIVSFGDVDEIYRVSSPDDCDEFVLTRGRRGTVMQFSSPNRDMIIQSIRSARARLQSSRPQNVERFGGISSNTASLLNIGLLNICHEVEWPRGAANELLSALALYLNYEAAVSVLPAKSHSIILNPSAAIATFSKRMASFAPHLTLDLLSDFQLGLRTATGAQHIACLSYLPPWIRNLDFFVDPINSLYEPDGTKVRDAIRSLVDITIRESEASPLVQQYVWNEVRTMSEAVINISVDEFTRVAVDGGIDSRRCDIAAASIMALSSIHVRSRIVMRLRQALRKASLRNPVSLAVDTAWDEIASLSRLALAASSNPRLPIQDQLLIPETMHLVTMLAATGPLPMRTSIYGMAVNVLHAVYASRVNDEGNMSSLRGITNEVSGLDSVGWFGLTQTEPCMAYATAKQDSYQIEVASLESITQLFLRAIYIGAKSKGILNVWRARWMSLVTATAFQEFPYMQTRAFTVLGMLIKSNVDDDFFYQILVALKGAIRGSPDGNSSAVASMLRCMRKAIPNLLENSRYLPGVFWIAVALLEIGHLPYYVESTLLMLAALEALYSQGTFRHNDIPAVLLTARAQLSTEMDILDGLTGFSFQDQLSFSVSLGFLLYAGAQHQTLRSVSREAILTLLRLTSRTPAPAPSSYRTEVAQQVSPSVVGLFLTSLPFCTTATSFRTLLEDANVDVAYWDSKGVLGETVDGGEAPLVPFSILGVNGDTQAKLVISLIYAMIQLYQGSILEREMLYTLLVEASESYSPLVLESHAHYLRGDWLAENLKYSFSSEITTPIQRALHLFLGSLVVNKDESMTPRNTSSSTISSVSEGQRITPHALALEELGMRGLLTHLRPESLRAKERRLPTEMIEDLLEAVMNM